MAYSGTTAASSVTNPPQLLAKSLGGRANTTSTGGSGGGLWYYASTNGTTEAQAANFFSDAYYIGMKIGDVVIGVSNTGSSTQLWMGVMGAISTAGGTFASTGSVYSSSSNP